MGEVQAQPGQEPAAAAGAAGFYSQWDDHEFINDFSRVENVFSSGTIDGQQLYNRGVKAFRDYAPVTTAAGRASTDRAVGQEPRDLLPRRALVPQRQGEHERRLRQPADRPAGPGADRAAERPRRCSRSDPSLAQPVSQACLDAINDPNRTILGEEQMNDFLHDVSLAARFKVVMNEVPIQQFYAHPYDRWEGYEADRQRVLSGLQGVNNVVFLTTDVHATFVNDARFKTLEPGGPQNSGILEATVGPAATASFAREINDTVGLPFAAPLIDNLFFEPQPPSGLGMQCSGIDQFSYGEVTASSTQLTITPKDIHGNPLTTDDGACGPFVLNFQP